MGTAQYKTDKAERREALVRLAMDLIAEEGLAACTFRNLAAREGRTTRPFTYEFGSRSELLAAVAHVAWEELGFSRGNEPKPGADPLAQLYELCSRAVPLTGMDDPAMRVYTAILCHSAEDPDLGNALAEEDRAGIGDYLQLVRAAQDKGQIPKERDPEDVIAAIWALGDGLILAAVHHPDHFTPERTQRIWKQGFEALTA